MPEHAAYLIRYLAWCAARDKDPEDVGSVTEYEQYYNEWLENQ